MNGRPAFGLSLAVFCGVLLIGIAVQSCAREAQAHDALPTAFMPDGWSYPVSCCSGYDCREVSEGHSVQVEERGGSWVISTTGEVIPDTDPKVKRSPDGLFHWCSKGGSDDGATICLFVPPRMS